MNPLYVRDGDEFQIAAPRVILERAQELIVQHFTPGTPALNNAQDTHQILRLRLGGLEHEIFAALFLNAHHELIEYVELFRGSVSTATVHPREVVKEALARNAAAVIFAHNHPSGHPEPSKADEEITRKLKTVLELFDIRIIDHIVVAGIQTYSFAEHGLL